MLKGGSIEGLQKPKGLAESVPVDAKRLQGYQEIPKGGVVRPHKPDAAFGGIHCGEHSRGLRPQRRRGTRPLCPDLYGSASELEFHLLLARDLGLLDAGEFDLLSKQTVEVKRMLTAFWQKLKAEC